MFTVDKSSPAHANFDTSFANGVSKYSGREGWSSIISDLPLSGVEDGQFISFVYKGNVRKPPGKFILKTIRHGEQSTIIYSDVSTLTLLIYNWWFYGN